MLTIQGMIGDPMSPAFRVSFKIPTCQRAASVPERWLAVSGLLGKGFVVEAAQDPFVEGGDRFEFGGSEQVDEKPAYVAHVLRRGLLDGATPAGQQDDLGTTAIGGVGFAVDQPLRLQVPDLTGEPALLPPQ